MEVLRFGYRIPFRVIPSLSQVPIPLPSYSPSSIRGIAVADLQEKGAVEPAPSSPGCYSRLFVSPKITVGWRLVIDLSRLNRSVLVSHFHMETAQSVLQFLCPGDWMVSLDLQDAYLQVPVHPSSRHYLWFFVGDSVLQFQALCFGLSTAPQVFKRVMAPICSIMHRYGFRILRYLDDWLVLGSSFLEIVRARDFLVWLCQELGVRVNLGKSSLTPSQTLDYLGMSLQTRPLKVFPTRKRVLKLSSMLLEFVSCRLQPLLLWRQLLGGNVFPVLHRSGISSSDEISAALPQCCRSPPSRFRFGGLGRFLPRGSSVVVRRVPSICRSASGPSAARSRPVHQRLGFGLGRFSRGRPSVRLVVSRVFWYSINRRELLAVLYEIRGFLNVLRSQSVSFFVDNTTALSYLRNRVGGGGHSSTLNSVVQAILRFCEDNQIRLVPQFVPGHLNVLADSLSHCSQVLGSKWTLCHEALRELLRLWPATINLFATSFSARFPVYFSPVADPQSAGTDAMMQPWDGLQAYAFPPFSLLNRVLLKVRQSRGLELTLVAPFWPLVSGPSGASGGCPSVTSSAEGSSQTAPLPSLSPEPPRALSDCISYFERSVRSFGFSSAVARQLACC